MVDLSGAGASGLETLDDLQRLLVGNLSKDDVLAIQPAGDDGGDKELGAVARGLLVTARRVKWRRIYVLGPALAMDRSPGLLWTRLKFSSANFSP